MEIDHEKRLQAVKYARASIELEGFTLSALDEQHAADYIDGRITLEQFTGTAPSPGQSCPSAP